MGLHTDVGSYLAAVDRWATVVERSQRQGVTAASFAVKDELEAKSSAAGLSPGADLAGVKWKGVRFRQHGPDKNKSTVYGGKPAWLHNNPIQPHFIGARLLGTRNSLRGKGRRVGAILAFEGSTRGVFGAPITHIKTRRGLRARKGKLALTVGGKGGNLRAYAFHQGTTGAGWWQKGVKSGSPKAMKAYQLAQRRELIKV